MNKGIFGIVCILSVGCAARTPTVNVSAQEQTLEVADSVQPTSCNGPAKHISKGTELTEEDFFTVVVTVNASCMEEHTGNSHMQIFCECISRAVVYNMRACRMKFQEEVVTNSQLFTPTYTQVKTCLGEAKPSNKSTNISYEF